MSIKEQMMLAREHIQAKQYDEARAILNTIDHPKAREWLARIDQMGEPTPAITSNLPAPRTSSRRGMFLLSTVMIIVLVSVAGLVFVLPTFSNPAQDSSEKHPLASYFPEDSIIYAELRTDEGHIKTWDNLVSHIQASLPAFVSGMLGDEPYTLSSSLDLLTEMSLNADFETAIRSWLGDQSAVGIYNMPASIEAYTMSEYELGIVGVVQITDRDKAISFVDDLLSLSPTLTYVQSDSDGYTFFRSTDTTEPIIMIHDQVMIIASPYASTIIQNGISKPLTASPQFIETMALLPESQYNASLYIQTERIFRGLLPLFEAMESEFSLMMTTLPHQDVISGEPPSFSIEDFLPEDITIDDALDAIGQMAMGFTILDDYTIVVDSTNNMGESELLEQFDYLIPNTKSTNPEFLSFIPADASIVVQGTDIHAYVDRLLETERFQTELMEKYVALFPTALEGMETAPVQAAITRIDDIIQPVTGLTVQDNIISWMTGDYAYFLTYEPSINSMLFNYYYPDQQFEQNIEGGLIIEATDAEQARLIVESLGSAIPLILDDLTITITHETIADQTVIVVNIPSKDLLSIPIELVVATRKTATDILNGQGGFDSSAGYTTVQPRLLAEKDSLTYINTDGFDFIVDATVGLLPPLIDNMMANLQSQLAGENEQDLTVRQTAIFEQQRQSISTTVPITRWVTALFDSITVSTLTNDHIDTVSRFTLTFAE